MPLTKREAEKLASDNGAKLLRRGSRHDIWITATGVIFEIPRHSKDLSRGTEHDIKSKLGVK